VRPDWPSDAISPGRQLQYALQATDEQTNRLTDKQKYIAIA